MAVHVHKIKKNGKVRTQTMGSKWNNITKSERKFNKHWLAGVEMGYFKVTVKDEKGKIIEKGDLSETQYDLLKDLMLVDDKHNHNGAVLCQPYSIYSNSERTASKPTFYLTSKMAHSPLREISDSSRRVSEGRLLAQTVLEMARYRSIEELQALNGGKEPKEEDIRKPQAYFLTLTVPNCDKGDLKVALSELSTNSSAVLKALKDGTRNKNGLRLRNDVDGNYVNFLGAMVSLEITVNLRKMRNHDTAGLYHPHAHILLLFDRPLLLGDGPLSASTTMFNYWQAKNSNSWLSRQAFDLERCYDSATGTMKMADAIKEASKYAIKPDFYTRFPSVPDDWSVSVFAELMKAIKGRKMKRSTGLFYEAQGYISWLKKGAKDNDGVHHDIYSAVLSGHYSDEDDSRVPDIFTHSYKFERGQLDSHDAKTEWIEKDEPDDLDLNSFFDPDFDPDSVPETKYELRAGLSAAEILYANSSLLSHSMWKLPSDIHWPNNDKAKLYKWLLERTVFFKKSTIDDWISYLDNMLLCFRDELSESQIRHYCCQLDDVKRLKVALGDFDGGSMIVPDFNEQYRRLALYDQMKQHRAKGVYKKVTIGGRKDGRIYERQGDVLDYISFDGLDREASREFEKLLVRHYLSDPLEDIQFISPDVWKDYCLWRWGFKSELEDENNLPNVALNLHCSMDLETFQKAVNNIH